jgi:hypothetical protein
MYGQPAGIDASIIWWALVVGLLVQAAIVYGCIRLALMHHYMWAQKQDAAAARAASRKQRPIIGAPND